MALIDQVVLPLEEAGETIDPERVADEVDKMLDPQGVCPELKAHCSILQLRQFARSRATQRHDPIARMKTMVEHGEDGQISAFSDELQPYYPVRRAATPGEQPKPVYVPRASLTEVEMRRICERLAKAGEALARHARNLEAWWISEMLGGAA